MIRTARIRLLATATVTLALCAIGHAQNFMTHHTRLATSNGQAPFLAPLPSSQIMRLTVTLPLRNQAGIESLLEQIYNPNSASYHHFLTVEQFTAQFGPTQDDYNTVVAYLQEHGFTIVGTSVNRLNIDVAGPVSAVNSAFHVKMGQYHHPTEDRTFFAPNQEPTVDLPFSLWHVSGLDNYSIPHPAGLSRRPDAGKTTSGATTGSGPSASFLGSDMRAAYYGSGSLTGAGQYLGLLEYYGTDLADLNTYFTNIGKTNPVPVSLVSTDGTSVNCVDTKAGGKCDDTEQTLDMTQAIGMAPGLSGLYMFVGSTDAAIFNAMATDKPLCNQLSSSWTWTPADPTTDDPYFEEFALQGQNIFQAAGDSGKWTTSGTASETYPADDVYVTTVGGTDLDTSSAAGPWSSETAWVDGGGGISPHKYALPQWQDAAAASCSSCSKSYRNGPDVSANANFTFYVCADQTTCTANEYGGTSFAAPMWAAYLALANQQSMTNNGKPIGFINPTLYTLGMGSSYDTDFHDITSGSNGYSATTGYDLATGWGSPNGSALITALAGASTPTPGYSLSTAPGSVTIAAGSSSSAVSISSTVVDGFDSPVTLSAAAATGITVTFASPGTITGSGSLGMTIAIASNVAAGTYPITITGTPASGPVETTSVSVTVTSTGTGTFTISVSPSSGSLDQGQSGYATVTTAVSGGFSAAISFSASGVPSGVTASFSPSSLAAPGSGTVDFDLTVAKTAKTGTYSITITGTGGGVTKSTTLKFTIDR